MIKPKNSKEGPPFKVILPSSRSAETERTRVVSTPFNGRYKGQALKHNFKCLAQLSHCWVSKRVTFHCCLDFEIAGVGGNTRKSRNKMEWGSCGARSHL